MIFIIVSPRTKYKSLPLSCINQDELIWGASWLYKATNTASYWDFVKSNIQTMDAGLFDFGWDSKQAGINVLVSQVSYLS